MTRTIRFCVDHPLLVLLLTVAFALAGALSLRTIPVDAIPDVSDDQVLVVCDWHGRAAEDVDDQVTQPIAGLLRGLTGVREVRGMSSFGMSMIYAVLEDGIDHAVARTRVAERIQSAGARLPEGVVPHLGPDATPLGQIYGYVLEVDAALGEEADEGDGLDLAALRALQDVVIRPALQSVRGVAEVASVGGLVREYQVEIDPARLRLHGLDVRAVMSAVSRASLDVGGGILEAGGAALVIRGRGALHGREDVERIVVALRGDGPVRLHQVADVVVGAELRAGALADERGERVGGLVTMRHGESPRDVITAVRHQLRELQPSLPPGVRVTPFYDRTRLIDETMGTLRETLLTEILVVVLVIWLFLLNLRVSLIVAITLPLGVLLAFIAMRLLGIPANLMSLAGIAIAIGAMDDMGIVMSESIFTNVQGAGELTASERASRIVQAAREVAPAITAAVATMLVSFLPVFFLSGQAGKLFSPLAWTKTLCVLGSLLVAIVVVPALCHVQLGNIRRPGEPPRGPDRLRGIRVATAAALGFIAGWMLPGLGVLGGVRPVWLALPAAIALGAAAHRLTVERLVPVDENPASRWIYRSYEPALRWVLAHRRRFGWIVGAMTLLGVLHYGGLRLVFAPLHAIAAALGGSLARVEPFRTLERALPPIGEAFMPPLDEGSLLYMPSLLPHASLAQTVEVMVRLNRRIRELPEVEGVMGKAGRAESALDPAPASMIETVVTLKPRHAWRRGSTPASILDELRRRTALVGVAPSWLHPIEARVVMLQSDLRAALALRITGAPVSAGGTAHEAIAQAAQALEKIVAGVPGAADVSALRTEGQPYLDLVVDRDRAARFNVNPRDVLGVVDVVLGGRRLAESVEGGRRVGVRVQLPRDLRDDVEAIGGMLVPTTAMADSEILGGSGHGGDGPGDSMGAAGQGTAVPLRWLVDLREVDGPALLRSEGGQPSGYVTFNADGRGEADVMADALAAVERWRVVTTRRTGRDPIPSGLRIEPAGRYLDKLEADRRLLWIVPLVLLLNLGLLYLAFRRWGLTISVFAAIPLAFGGGMLGLWIYPLLSGEGPVHLTTAVWVGFIALFGIAVDDGTLMATYLRQEFSSSAPRSVTAIREAVVRAGLRRIRPCLMTTATTIVSLLPVLWSSGRGADLMQPMALPLLGGLVASLVTLFTVPALFSWLEERGLPIEADEAAPGTPTPRFNPPTVAPASPTP